MIWFGRPRVTQIMARLGAQSSRETVEGAVSEKTVDHPGGTRPEGHTRVRGRLHRRLHANPAVALTTKVVVTAVGVLVICAGLVMMVAPGPGIVGVLVGLAILATEYDWADRWLRKAKEKAQEAKERAEAMDPRVRRRRLLLSGLAFVVVGGLIVWYVATYDWPSFAVTGWDWVQGLATWLPDLPGM